MPHFMDAWTPEGCTNCSELARDVTYQKDHLIWRFCSVECMLNWLAKMERYEKARRKKPGLS